MNMINENLGDLGTHLASKIEEGICVSVEYRLINNRSAVLSFSLPEKVISERTLPIHLPLIYSVVKIYSKSLNEHISPIKTEFTFDKNAENVLFTIKIQMKRSN